MTGAEDAALTRHPAGRRRLVDPGYGLRMVALREADTWQVVDAGGEPVGLTVDVPAVNVLECQTCEALFRVGSAGAVVHYRQHRLTGRARAWLRSPVTMIFRSLRRRAYRTRRVAAELLGWE